MAYDERDEKRPEATFEELVEGLYDLDRASLRRLAWEALLISDGPDRIEGDDASATIGAHFIEPNAFHIWDKEKMVK